METKISIDLIQTREQEFLQMCLASLAGYIDAFGLLRFKTYLSFMSGNTTQTGFLLGQGNFSEIKLAAAAILSFVFGVFLGSVASKLKWYKIGWMPFVFVSSSLLVYLMLNSCIVLSSFKAILILGTAMGFMNTAASQVGKQSINPDFVTGTLNSMAKHFALSIFEKYPPDSQAIWDTHKRRFWLLAFVWLSFISGAIISTILFPYYGNRVLFLPVLVLFHLSIRGFWKIKIKYQVLP